jgi:nitrile hydratase accessory protein
LSRPETPPGIEDPVFAEAWQAEAFALTVALHEGGLFTWAEWSATLSAELERPSAAKDGSDYYDHWVRALERLLAAKEVAPAADVENLTAAWHRAAEATPHGKPIRLENDPQFVP